MPAGLDRRKVVERKDHLNAGVLPSGVEVRTDGAAGINFGNRGGTQAAIMN